MSERTYTPRPGGRATESHTAEPRIAGPRRRPATGTEGDVRGARRQPEQPARKADRAERKTGSVDRKADRAERKTGPVDRGTGRAKERTTDRTTDRTAGRAKERLTERAKERTTGPVADRIIDHARARRAQAQREDDRRTGAGRGGNAPVQGTAALKLESAVAEPLRVQPEAKPKLRVAPPTPISAPRAPFIAGVIALVVVGVIGILLINTETNTNSFEIAQLKDQQTALDNEQQRLENQLAVYETSGNLAAAAKRLGLVRAEAPAYLRLPDGRVIGVPTPGKGKPAITAQDPDDKAKAVTNQQEPGQQESGQQEPVQQGTVPEGQLSGGQVPQGAGE